MEKQLHASTEVNVYHHHHKSQTSTHFSYYWDRHNTFASHSLSCIQQLEYSAISPGKDSLLPAGPVMSLVHFGFYSDLRHLVRRHCGAENQMIRQTENHFSCLINLHRPLQRTSLDSCVELFQQFFGKILPVIQFTQILDEL